MSKEQGLIITLEFSESLLTDCSGNENAFSIKFKQWDMVPGGSLIQVSRSIASTLIDSENDKILHLYFNRGITRNFQNAVGEIELTYDMSKGRLRGLGGPVASFTKTFLPEDLEALNNPHVLEHIDCNLTPSVVLKQIKKTELKSPYNNEHIDMDLVVSFYLGQDREE